MAIVDSNYEFIMCDVGTNGSISDGGVICNTKFYEKLSTDNLHVPPDENPRGSKTTLPYVFVGDEAFALSRNLLKPFNRKQLHYERMVFNYRLSRARRIVENAFGILSTRFRLFHSAINLKDIKHVNIVILTCCYLHNFLRKQCQQSYVTPDLNDTDNNIEVQGLVDLRNDANGRNISNDARFCRDKFVEYFINEGRVEWQDD